jgi:DnaJ-class molecular chaperone
MDFYKALNISKTATQEELKTAYRLQAMRYHPDKVSEGEIESATGKMTEINEAWRVLKVPGKRRLYDAGLSYDVDE